MEEEDEQEEEKFWMAEENRGKMIHPRNREQMQEF